jgi:hypothetical protein
VSDLDSLRDPPNGLDLVRPPCDLRVRSCATQRDAVALLMSEPFKVILGEKSAYRPRWVAISVPEQYVVTIRKKNERVLTALATYESA